MGFAAASVSYNAFVVGIGFLGKVEDFKEPAIKKVKIETPDGVKIDGRMVELGEAEINLNSVNGVIYRAMMLNERAVFEVKEVVVEDGKTKNITHIIMGTFDVEENSTKAKEVKKKNIKINPIQYTKEVEGEQVIFIDLENKIGIIDGIDILADIRNAIN